MDEIDKSIEGAVTMARAVAESGDDDTTEWLRAALSSLDDAIVEQREAARAAVATGDTAALQVAVDSVASQLALVKSQSTKKVAGKATDEQVVKKALETCEKALDQLEESSKVSDGNNAAAAARALVDALALVITILL